METLYIADESLTGQGGHYVEYVRALASYAQQTDLTLRVLAHRTLPSNLMRELGAEPVFRQDFWQRATNRRKIGFILNPIQSNWIYFRDISHALRGRANRQTVVFVPTIDHRQMLAYAWWLASLPKARRPHVVMLFRYTYFSGAHTTPWRSAWWVRLAGRALAPLRADGRVRYVTDSARLARQYRSLLSAEVDTVPIPHTADIVSVTAPHGHDRTLRLAFLGDAREEKGFAVFVRALEQLGLAAPEVMRDLSFLLQCHVSPAHWRMADIREALRAKGLRNVTLIDQSLSRLDYCELLADMDAALLPYWRNVYYARTSGPFTEALAAGKPVVVTSDTWMSDELSTWGAGLTVDDHSVDHLVQRIIELHSMYPALVQLAHERQGPWVDRHNPRALILALASGLN